MDNVLSYEAVQLLAEIDKDKFNTIKSDLGLFEIKCVEFINFGRSLLENLTRLTNGNMKYNAEGIDSVVDNFSSHFVSLEQFINNCVKEHGILTISDYKNLPRYKELLQIVEQLELLSNKVLSSDSHNLAQPELGE